MATIIEEVRGILAEQRRPRGLELDEAMAAGVTSFQVPQPPKYKRGAVPRETKEWERVEVRIKEIRAKIKRIGDADKGMTALLTSNLQQMREVQKANLGRIRTHIRKEMGKVFPNVPREVLEVLEQIYGLYRLEPIKGIGREGGGSYGSAKAGVLAKIKALPKPDRIVIQFAMEMLPKREVLESIALELGMKLWEAEEDEGGDDGSCPHNGDGECDCPMHQKRKRKRKGQDEAKEGKYQAKTPLEKSVAEMVRGQSGLWVTEPQMKGIIAALHKKGIKKPGKDAYDDIARAAGAFISKHKKGEDFEESSYYGTDYGYKSGRYSVRKLKDQAKIDGKLVPVEITGSVIIDAEGDIEETDYKVLVRLDTKERLDWRKLSNATLRDIDNSMLEKARAKAQRRHHGEGVDDEIERDLTPEERAVVLEAIDEAMIGGYEIPTPKSLGQIRGRLSKDQMIDMFDAVDDLLVVSKMSAADRKKWNTIKGRNPDKAGLKTMKIIGELYARYVNKREGVDELEAPQQDRGDFASVVEEVRGILDRPPS